jgi:hypothetical protein
MKLLKSIVVVSVLGVAVAACQSNTQFKENMLSSAGFKQTQPTTPAQMASLKSLPPHKLMMKTTPKGKIVWVYSDPTMCGCLYVGNQAAYDAYSRSQYQRTQLDMRTVTAPPDNANWDFGAWPDAAMEP